MIQPPLTGMITLPDGTLIRGRGRREPLPAGPAPRLPTRLRGGRGTSASPSDLGDVRVGRHDRHRGLLSPRSVAVMSSWVGEFMPR